MSKIEVNTITEQSGTTVTVGGGACKTAVIDATTVTLGRSGATVSLAPGASQSGFGRTGTVDWCTTAKTSPLTAVSGKGYFINTTDGAITVTLPSSPSAGDIVSLKDYAKTWDSNSVTLARGGSKINGVCACAELNTESQAVTLIYVDSTKGWQNIMDSTDVTGNQYITATGGTITTCGNDKIHTFTSSGTFTVSKAACAAANNAVAYMVVAGGGYGSSYLHGSAAGGGAGGFREGTTAPVVPYTASPLVAPTGITVSAQAYPITVGAGAASGSTNGSSSVFSTITSTGGGRGGASGGNDGAPYAAAPGGSGGGGDGECQSSAGSGNTPPVSPSQGNNGGAGQSIGGNRAAGGGGGAGAAGSAGSSPQSGGAGGAGVSTQITGSAVTRAGGGGGQGQTPGGSGGAGGSGGGGAAGGNPGNPGNAGTANTGGGGGAGNTNSPNTAGGSGGSGIVVLRYKYQ